MKYVRNTLFFSLAAFLLWATPAFADLGGAASSLRPSLPSNANFDQATNLILPTIQLGTSRILEKTAAQKSPFGLLHQFQTNLESFTITYFVVGIPLFIASLAVLGGNVTSLFRGWHSFAWGVLGIVTGGLSMAWSFVSIAIDKFIVFGLPLLLLGGLTLAFGFANVFLRPRRFRRRYRRRRYYRPRYGFLPWFNVNKEGHKQGGLAVVGQF